MIITKTNLDGTIIIQPQIFDDVRGHFFESYKSSVFLENNLPVNFLQDNQVKSRKNVLRGLHYQLNKPQGKLVRVISGRILDVALDIRKNSATFGEHLVIELSDRNKKMFYIPEGFAHGYVSLSEDSIVLYKCTNEYNPSDEYGIKWNDKELGIDWKVKDPIISKKDLKLPTLKNQKFLPEL